MTGGSDENPATGELGFAVTQTSARTQAGVAPTPTPSERPLAPLQLRDAARYEVVTEHGRGGLGRVMRAHDKELGRDVAIKELLDRGNASELRFYREALITARLEHPGIVPVHEAGRWADGTPFYAMKLVAGRPLKDLIEAAHGLAERLALVGNVIAVADAVAYAHDRRVIHRDLKPANVIVGEFGETVVIDWGLAKLLDDPDDASASERPPAGGDITVAGSVLGTPAYMAPEQYAGRADERSDIYALGGMLYHVLTGAPPHAGAAGRASFPRGVPRDLTAIVDRAMAADPARRYATAQAFADDLRRFQRRVPVRARRYSIVARLALGLARYRTLALVFVGALVVLAITLAVSLSKIAGERAEAIRQRGAAVDAQRSTQRAKDDLLLQNAELLLRSDPTAAVTALADYRGDNRVRHDMLVAEAVGRGVARRVVTAHSAGVWFVGADAHGAIYSISRDQTLRMTVDAQTTTLAHDVASAVVAYAPARRVVAYARAPSGIVLFDLATHATVAIDTGTPEVMAFSPDETRLVELSARGRVRVWQLASAPSQLLELTVPGANDAIFAGSSRVLVMDGNTVRAIPLGDASTAASLALRAAPTAFAADAAGERIAIGDDSGAITLASPLAALQGQLPPQASLAVCRKQINAVAFVPHSGLIAYACRDGIVGVVREDAPRLVTVDSFATAGTAIDVRTDPSGHYLIAFDEANTVFAYDLETRLVSRYIGHGTKVTYIAAHTADLPFVASGDTSGTFRLWPIPGRAARILLQLDYGVSDARFSPDGRRLVVTGITGAVRIVDLATGATTPLIGHTALAQGPTFTVDGDRVVTSSNDGTARVWRSDGTPLAAFNGHHGSVARVDTVEPDRVASIAEDGRLLLWPIDASSYTELFHASAPLVFLRALSETHQIVVGDARGAVSAVTLDGRARTIRAASSALTTLRASRDGARIAIGSDDGEVTVYETATWTSIARRRATAAIQSVQFDRDARAVVYTTADAHVCVLAIDGPSSLGWDDLSLRARNPQFSADGRTLALPVGAGGTWLYAVPERRWMYVQDHQSQVSAGLFSPDGRWFVSYDSRGIVTLRDVEATRASQRE